MRGMMRDVGDASKVADWLNAQQVRRGQGEFVDQIYLNAQSLQILIDYNLSKPLTDFDKGMIAGGAESFGNALFGISLAISSSAPRPDEVVIDGRRVPNPGGRLGDAVTRQTAQNVIADLKGRGFTQVRQEVMFEKGPLGVKTRYGDIVATNPTTGETVIVNIGKMRSDGVPIIRERQAMDDIIFSPTIQQYPNSRIIFIEKGASGLPPGFK